MSVETYMPKQGQIERRCVLMNAEGQILGRFATHVATILMGKDEPFYTPHLQCGDQVIVINAEQIRVTGRKAKTKQYQTYSGYPGGRRVVSFEKMREQYPERIIKEAVRRMLPGNRLRAKILKQLHVYKGSQHPHAAQKPVTIELR